MSEFNLEDASGVHSVRPEEISFERGTALLIDDGYEPEAFVALWRYWIERGDVVLIFENADMGHYALGHTMSMPWDPALPFPPHAPDHPAVGLGWRYVSRYVVRADNLESDL